MSVVFKKHVELNHFWLSLVFLKFHISSHNLNRFFLNSDQILNGIMTLTMT